MTSSLTDRLAKARAARQSGAQPSTKSTDEMLKQAALDRPAAEIAKIAKRLEDVPETMRRTYLRAVSGRSRPAAIKAFCAECVGWDRARTVHYRLYFRQFRRFRNLFCYGFIGLFACLPTWQAWSYTTCRSNPETRPLVERRDVVPVPAVHAERSGNSEGERQAMTERKLKPGFERVYLLASRSPTADLEVLLRLPHIRNAKGNLWPEQLARGAWNCFEPEPPPVPLPPPWTPQVGQWVRAWEEVTGVVTEMDDDGNSATIWAPSGRLHYGLCAFKPCAPDPYAFLPRGCRPGDEYLVCKYPVNRDGQTADVRHPELAGTRVLIKSVDIYQATGNLRAVTDSDCLVYVHNLREIEK